MTANSASPITRRALFAVAASTALAGCAGGSRPSAADVQAPSASPSVVPSTARRWPAVSQARLRFGVAAASGPTGNEIQTIADAVGETPSLVSIFKDFKQAPPLQELDVTAGMGAIPVLTWEPWDWDRTVDQPEYALSKIARGDFDPYLREWGSALGAWGRPVILRFAHEMNGNWYPWGELVNGNRGGEYVAAWRHVHQVVSEATKASNVQWAWTPNENYDGGQDLSLLYPGAEFVDIVGIDGYNWGASQPWSIWRDPQRIFSQPLAALRKLAPGKPIIVGETSSVNVGGSRASWLAALVQYLGTQPDVTGFVLFDELQEVDWRVSTDPQALTSLRQALAARG